LWRRKNLRIEGHIKHGGRIACLFDNDRIEGFPRQDIFDLVDFGNTSATVRSALALRRRLRLIVEVFAALVTSVSMLSALATACAIGAGRALDQLRIGADSRRDGDRGQESCGNWRTCSFKPD
jgi:hypothetical protein